jgi:hypothetical protein
VEKGGLGQGLVMMEQCLEFLDALWQKAKEKKARKRVRL